MSEQAGGEGIWHGGDLAAARARFPLAPEPWIDLSTGINPISYPLPALPLSLWQRLPGAAEEKALLAAARRAYRVPRGAGLVAAPGTQILIGLMPRLAAPGPVAVLGPTYAEHAACWRAAGFAVSDVDAVPEFGEARHVVLVNPNNPDGRITPVSKLQAIAAHCAARDGLLIVDEAFCDFTPEASLIPDLPEAAIVLRSFGKSYGLAGLRLGFAVAAPAMAERLAAMLGPWAVAGPALAVGAAALADEGWLAAAAEARRRDATRLDTLLAPLGRIMGGTTLYRLLAMPAAPTLFERLGQNGIHVRRFQHDATLLRFGLPANEEAWRRLERGLSPASFQGMPPA